MTVTQYIQENIGKAVCQSPSDTDKVMALPYPYSVPTVGEKFHAMFYWDTYFTNLAHLSLGQVEQTVHNAENFAALIERLGFIPNGNKFSLCDRSQPPFFALMIRDIYAETEDRNWLAHIYPYLCREHAFWHRERNTEQGLAHYGTSVPDDREEQYARAYCRRIGEPYSSERQKNLAENFLSQAESGWDFNARFGFESLDFCAVDLNALLWSVEDQLAKFAEILQNGEGAYWRSLAELRAVRMRAFLKNDRGIFCDRNVKTGEYSAVASMASIYPLFVGLATAEEAEAVRSILPKLMHPFGVVPVEQHKTPLSFQWGAPNGWPCLQVIAAVGLRRYGLIAEAKAIEDAYVSMVERVFEKTGALWEKYNVDTGDCDAVNEYEMPEMLGWTAGAYLYFKGLK